MRNKSQGVKECKLAKETPSEKLEISARYLLNEIHESTITCRFHQENRQQQQQILILRTEVDNLRSDNVKLYEKIKFLQSYPTSKVSLPSCCHYFRVYASKRVKIKLNIKDRGIWLFVGSKGCFFLKKQNDVLIFVSLSYTWHN